MNDFRIRGLPASDFSGLFQLSDAELEARHARRMIAENGGYPCRISLTDATPGETVILVNYEHHRANSPYRSNFAVYVREHEERFDAIGEIPAQLRRRTLALRGYDAAGMLRTADIVEGRELETGIASVFADARIAYIHAHFAKPGCYAALIERH